MAKLKLLSTIFSKLSTISNKEGQVIISRDSKSLYIDMNGERIEITDWIDVSTEEILLATLTPITNKYYFTKDTNKIWKYINGEWVCLNGNNHTHSISDINNLTTTTSELNYVSGTTSNIQKQLNSKVKFNSDNTQNINTDPFLTQSQIVDNLNSTSSIRPLSANQGRLLNEKIGKNTMPIPSYYDTYLKNKIATIREKETICGINSDSFVFITDYHMDYSNRKSNSPALIYKIMHETNTRFVMFGGDGITISYNSNDHKQLIKNFINEWSDDILNKFYPITGNHEYNAPTGGFYLNDYDVYNTLEKRFVEYNNNAISSGLNYYFDNTNRKIRYMMIACTKDAIYTSETLTWVKNTIKNTPSGWYILICCHRGIVDGVKTSNPSGIYRHGTYSNGTSVQADICNTIDAANAESQATVIGILSGHQHADIALKTSGGLNVIATNCDSAEGDCQEGRDRTIGATSEQCFEVVNIDLTNRKIYLTRIGAYSDRSFTF